MVGLRLGFIGTGNITTALVEGLCTAQDAPASVFVSPRNPEKAASRICWLRQQRPGGSTSKHSERSENKMDIGPSWMLWILSWCGWARVLPNSMTPRDEERMNNDAQSARGVLSYSMIPL